MSPYPPDRTFGMVIALFSGLCACCISGFTFFVGVIAAVIGSHAEGVAAPHLFGALAALAFFVAIGLILGYVIAIIGGIGIANGKRWGFNLVLVLSIMRAILNLGQLPHGLLFIAFDLACVVYCYRRLSGAEGPPPQ